MQKDYKDTINLPKTGFPMKGSLGAREPEALEEQRKIYQELKKGFAVRPKFIIADGPPYANGQIHIGHALNKIIKDIICRYKTLRGFDVDFKPGFDCHGLPVELQVEKSGSFSIENCRKYACLQVKKQTTDFQRLNIFADFEDPYLTMQPEYESYTLDVLERLMPAIKSDLKPVHWCIHCQSSLAESEVEYFDKISKSTYFLFPVLEEERWSLAFVRPVLSKTSLLVWTTTSWTIPENKALALGADLMYVLVCSDQGYLIFGKEALASLARFFTNLVILSEALGSALAGLKVVHPFSGERPVILAEHVVSDSGTGVVHTAPAHGVEDFLAGVANNLSLSCNITATGTYNEGYFIDQSIFHVHDAVVAKLQENAALFSVENYTHSYPRCWRHKTPLIFRSTEQWFLTIDHTSLIKCSKEVNWRGKEKLMSSMISGRPDWCISRQRFWGVPIPCDKNLTLQENRDLIKESSQIVKNGGIERYAAHAKNSNKKHDVLDVWFDSSCVIGFLQRKLKDFSPVDLVVEGVDQFRGWFQGSLIVSSLLHGKAPFKTVISHGFVVDENGEKMSKSLGNVKSPMSIANNLGADVLRLWAASSNYTDNSSISDEILERTVDSYRKIRNTCRYLLANSSREELVNIEDLFELDKWVITQACIAQKDILEAYENYNFHKVVKAISSFCNLCLSNFYINVTKDRQYMSNKDSLGFKSAQTACYHVLQALLRWITPILPFTAEEAYTYLGKKNLITEAFYDKLDILVSVDLWDKVLSKVDTCNKQIEQAKHQGIVASSAESVLHVQTQDFGAENIALLQKDLRFLLMVAEVHMSYDEKEAVTVSKSKSHKCPRCWFYDESVLEDVCCRCAVDLENVGKSRESI